MSFLDHLEDLRTRIIRSCIALAIGMAIAFVFMDRLAAFVLAPTLYMLSIGIAWPVGGDKPRHNPTGLRLVFAAAVIDQASRRTRR